MTCMGSSKHIGPCFPLAGGLCKFYASSGGRQPIKRQLLFLVQYKQQANPVVSIHNYSPLVISRNDKNKKLTSLSYWPAVQRTRLRRYTCRRTACSRVGTCTGSSPLCSHTRAVQVNNKCLLLYSKQNRIGRQYTVKNVILFYSVCTGGRFISSAFDSCVYTLPHTQLQSHPNLDTQIRTPWFFLSILSNEQSKRDHAIS